MSRESTEQLRSEAPIGVCGTEADYMAAACDHSPQQVRVAEAFTDVKGGGGATENAKKEIMSKDKEGLGSEARIALNLHKRPRRRARTWSVGIGEGCGDTALYIFDLRNASPIKAIVSGSL